ncbi:hypothetical protein [Amycolatopsis sp.]|jgi:hypothetical protein|uniref:hypothetical protein n=1 Tax=Amycolatopsis sp. TaxID=37632 RepID=UPI002E07E10F|nr:hypothetical protein [Amycolatopsis sp.]
MSGEDEELVRMLTAWRNDIESVPFPTFDVATLPISPQPIPTQRQPERTRGLRGLVRMMRAGKGEKAR